MIHPHPDKSHVVRSVRRYLIGVKKKFGSARRLLHYQALIATYKAAKAVLAAQ